MLNITMSDVFTMLKTHKNNEYKVIWVDIFTEEGLKLIRKFPAYDGVSNNSLEDILKEMKYYPDCFNHPVESVAFFPNGTVIIKLEGRDYMLNRK